MGYFFSPTESELVKELMVWHIARSQAEFVAGSRKTI